MQIANECKYQYVPEGENATLPNKASAPPSKVLEASKKSPSAPTPNKYTISNTQYGTTIPYNPFINLRGSLLTENR